MQVLDFGHRVMYRALIQEDAELCIYDPKVPAEEIKLLFPSVSICNSPYAASREAHAVVILTEWDEFKSLDYDRIFKSMQRPAFVFDGRNIIDNEKLKKIGFNVVSIGKQPEMNYSEF